ncbi:MAG TPA: M48 family metallopeptidase [Anaerolineae bacterium]
MNQQPNGSDEVSTDDIALDPQRQQSARSYAAIQRRLMVAELALSGVLVVAFLFSGGSRWLKVALSANEHANWVLIAGYVAACTLAYSLITLPLSWYGGYLLPHRYGLSTQGAGSWISDELKSLLLGLVLGIPVAEVIYWLLGSQPDAWWAWAGVFLIAVTVLLGHLGPVLIVPLFYKLTPLRDPELLDRITDLAERTRTRIAGTYTINLSSRSTAANAMVMGLGSTKRIALGDTLYSHYTPDEIETIIAHELGHQVHHDLELGILVQSILLLAGMYVAQLFLRRGVAYFGFSGPGDIAALPLLLLAIGIFSLVTLPLSNGYSRWRERLADRFAVHTTGKRTAFIRAMLRLANQNLSEADPPRWVVWLLYSHPPIRDRVNVTE